MKATGEGNREGNREVRRVDLSGCEHTARSFALVHVDGGAGVLLHTPRLVVEDLERRECVGRFGQEPVEGLDQEQRERIFSIPQSQGRHF